MKAQPRIVTVCVYSWLLVIVLAAAVAPQQDSQFQPVRISKGEKVDLSFRYLRPVIGDPKADILLPEGKATVTRDDEFTSIDIELWRLPRNPGRYFLYLIHDDNTAQEIHKFGTELRLLYQAPSTLESFRLAVSTTPDLTIIEPGRADVVMISIAP